MKILIADDTNTDRLLLKLHLSKLGHQVIEAVDGEKVIEQYTHYENELDLILMDVQMPKMNGFEAVKLIREVEEDRGLEWVPIIFLSASANADDIEKGIEAGGDDYLIKPIHQKVLMAKMLAMQRIADMRRRLMAANAILEEQASIDHLTGILNRRAFEVIVDREINLAKRNGQSFSFALFDLDLFKKVNDSLGHDAGDEVLKGVVQRISKALRQGDLIGRIGGEEFGLLISGASKVEAHQVFERFRELVAAKPIEYQGQAICITISIGAVTYQLGEDIRESLYKRADVCLYEAKDTGRNKVVFE